MALGATEQLSGGQVRDADGRRVVKVVAGQGSEVHSGGQMRDGDGRASVIVDKGATS